MKCGPHRVGGSICLHIRYTCMHVINSFLGTELDHMHMDVWPMCLQSRHFSVPRGHRRNIQPCCLQSVKVYGRLKYAEAKQGRALYLMVHSFRALYVYAL